MGFVFLVVAKVNEEATGPVKMRFIVKLEIRVREMNKKKTTPRHRDLIYNPSASRLQ